MPWVKAEAASPSGIPQTSQASRKAVEAPATAAFQGAARRTASATASTTSGSAATSADRATLPPTGSYTWRKIGLMAADSMPLHRPNTRANRAPRHRTPAPRHDCVPLATLECAVRLS